MKILNKKLIILLTIISIIAVIFPVNVQAAGSFTISKSSASLNPGGTTTITVTASGCAGQFSISSSNNSVATVGSSSVWLDNSSTTITVTAKSVGSASINITASDVTDTDLNEVVGTKTCAITVTNPVPPPSTEPEKPTTNAGTTGGSSTSKPTTTKPSSNNSTTSKPTQTEKKSNNSKLASLQIAEGTIAPEFTSSITEYSISVPNEVTKLSIAAIAESSKATTKITGNEELQVGENNIEVIVTAEDGSKTTYKILVKRAQAELSLQALTAFYIDENGEKIVLSLNPIFSFDLYEYTIKEVLPHTVKELLIEGVANRENAKIEVLGNTELKTGKNTITVKTTLVNEENLEEQKTYTIKVEKKEEPVVAPVSTRDKIENWFSGIGSTLSKWATENFERIITGMLLIATVAFVGLTIYFAYDYKNYQKVLAKLAELNKANLMERANVALDPESTTESKVEEDIVTENVKKIEEDKTEKEQPKVKLGRGKRFK